MGDEIIETVGEQEKNKYYRYAKKPKTVYYIICGIYLILSGLTIFLLLDETSHTSDPLLTLALVGSIITFIGCILLIARTFIGLLLTMTGSMTSIIFSLVSGLFHRNDRFYADEFILFLLFTILPGLILLPQVLIIIKTKMSPEEQKEADRIEQMKRDARKREQAARYHNYPSAAARPANVPQEALGGVKKVRHIVGICYDAPYINSLKGEMQNFIVNAEISRGGQITPASRITFDSFYDNSALDQPDMIRGKLHQIFSQYYPQNAMFELADKALAREVNYRDGHVLVKYYVLYE
jgi:hypothetical protein